MFKKRNQKGQRAKVIRRDSENESDSSDDETVAKRAKITEEKKITKKIEIISSDSKLTKNEEATKVDILNQELIDKDRDTKSKHDEKIMDDGTYKGLSNYTKFINPRKEDNKGPKKASSNIRSTTIFDFARDVCKDYNQTGFCGYGDSCKFLHARDDFKAGWKLNKDWDLNSKGEEEENLKEIPFKCVICKKDYRSPIKTTCNHYFCESCFLTRNRKTPNCFICGKNTNGVALPAKDLKSKKRNTHTHTSPSLHID